MGVDEKDIVLVDKRVMGDKIPVENCTTGNVCVFNASECYYDDFHVNIEYIEYLITSLRDFNLPNGTYLRTWYRKYGFDDACTTLSATSHIALITANVTLLSTSGIPVGTYELKSNVKVLLHDQLCFLLSRRQLHVTSYFGWIKKQIWICFTVQKDKVASSEAKDTNFSKLSLNRLRSYATTLLLGAFENKPNFAFAH